METGKILQSDYLDLIFDKRNKSYGGYQLRKHYNGRALKALGITFSILLLGIGTPFLITKLNAKSTDEFAAKPPVETVLTEVVLPPPPKAPEAPKPPKAALAALPPVAKTKVFTEPKIVNTPIKPALKPPDIKDLDHSLAGPVNNDGEGGDIAATSDKVRKGGFGDGFNGPDKKGGGGGGTSEEAVKFAEEMPEFPGGMAALLDFMKRNLHYPVAAREDGIEGKVIVSFVVNAKGGIEGAKVVRGIGGGCDKEALRVVNSMPLWKAGKQNGHFVKVYYTLPIAFSLSH